jgi:hypothetical protein
MYIKIKGYEKYSVSDTGFVRNDKTKKVKSFYPNGMGYRRAQLYKNGKTELKFIHKLVYENFVGDIPEGMVVKHKDGNITNNRLENLTLTERSKPNSPKYRRYTEETKREVYKELTEGKKVQEIADKYGITLQYLYRVKKDELWKS